MAQKMIIRIKFDPATNKNNIRVTFDPLLKALDEEGFKKLSITQQNQHHLANDIAINVMKFLQEREAKTQQSNKETT